jgi:hypothetical protein
MRIGFLVLAEECESCRKHDHRIAQVKMMLLGCLSLEVDLWEVASEKKTPELVWLQRLWLFFEVSNILISLLYEAPCS